MSPLRMATALFKRSSVFWQKKNDKNEPAGSFNAVLVERGIGPLQVLEQGVSRGIAADG